MLCTRNVFVARPPDHNWQKFLDSSVKFKDDWPYRRCSMSCVTSWGMSPIAFFTCLVCRVFLAYSTLTSNKPMRRRDHGATDAFENRQSSFPGNFDSVHAYFDSTADVWIDTDRFRCKYHPIRSCSRDDASCLSNRVKFSSMYDHTSCTRCGIFGPCLKILSEKAFLPSLPRACHNFFKTRTTTHNNAACLHSSSCMSGCHFFWQHRTSVST